jgi:hypothetical protein
VHNSTICIENLAQSESFFVFILLNVRLSENMIEGPHLIYSIYEYFSNSKNIFFRKKYEMMALVSLFILVDLV